MTKIIVDKKTALLAIMKYFNIPVMGTEPALYVNASNPINSLGIEIEFDFEKKKEDR